MPLGSSAPLFGHLISPLFELGNRTFGKGRNTREVVRIQNRAHAAQAMAGDGGNLGLGASRNRKPGDRRAAQIVKRKPDNTGVLAGALP